MPDRDEQPIKPMSPALEAAKLLIGAALKNGAHPDPKIGADTACDLVYLNEQPALQMQLMLDAVRYLYLAGKPMMGLEVADQAKKFAVQIADGRSTALALSSLGICAADTGNLPRAMEAYAEALALSQGAADQLQEGRIWLNLSAALNYGGLYRESIGCLEHALKIARTTEGLKSYIPSFYMNMAICHLNLDEIPQGLLAIKKAVEYSSEPKTTHDIHNRVLAENYFTRLLIEIDDYAGALEHARESRRYAGMSKSPRSDITASVAEGLAEVFSGQADVGISRLTQTLDRARTLKVTIREVLVAIVKAHEHLGQHDKALEYLRQMLEAQRATQEANVLRHVEHHLEQLHLKEGAAAIEDGKQAIKRLETKREVLEGRIAKRDLFRQSVEGLERLAVATERRDDSTGEHSYRVGRLASMLAQEAGCDEEMVFMIDIAARLHDIGKIAIPDGILLKPGSFNDSERAIMEMHAEAGADVLAKSNIPQIKMAEDIARFHHERWDGEGYPMGLAGEDIPLAARITALADVFDALTHERPYKQAWTVDASLTQMLAMRGKHFEPRLTDLFLGMMSRLVREGHNLDVLLGEAARKSSFYQAKGKIWDSLKLAKDEYKAKSARALDLQRQEY